MERLSGSEGGSSWFIHKNGQWGLMEETEAQGNIWEDIGEGGESVRDQILQHMRNDLINGTESPYPITYNYKLQRELLYGI